jgi:hypothetical protein
MKLAAGLTLAGVGMFIGGLFGLGGLPLVAAAMNVLLVLLGIIVALGGTVGIFEEAAERKNAQL